MDLGFLLRAQRILGERRSAPIDYGVLVATLAAHQSATATARIADGSFAAGELASPEPLPELILSGPHWRQAAVQQQGCFNRAIAKRRVNGA